MDYNQIYFDELKAWEAGMLQDWYGEIQQTNKHIQAQKLLGKNVSFVEIKRNMQEQKIKAVLQLLQHASNAVSTSLTMGNPQEHNDFSPNNDRVVLANMPRYSNEVYLEKILSHLENNL